MGLELQPIEYADPERPKPLWLLAGVVLGLMIVVFTLCPLSIRPKTGHPDVERFAAFFITALVFTLALPRRARLVLVGVTAMAIVLEAAQLLVPGRDGRVADALVKALGGALGVLAGVSVRRLNPRGAIRPS
jgi:hypothetical protein